MKEGSLEFILGIFGGIGSLIKNTIAGTFTSVQKFSGSLASGFSAMTFVSNHRRALETHRPHRRDAHARGGEETVCPPSALLLSAKKDAELVACRKKQTNE